MLTTNKIQPKELKESKLRVIKADDVKVKEFDFTPREYPGVSKQETRRLNIGMITSHDYEEKLKPYLRRSKPRGRKKKK